MVKIRGYNPEKGKLFEMTTEKLNHILNIISNRLFLEKVPYAVIGALALGMYGVSRYTSDIDLIAQHRFQSRISKLMNNLGYHCFQLTDSFGQFDSDLGVLGRIDFMFVQTEEGDRIIEDSVIVDDDLLGSHPIIQPTSYIVLKLMAIANNPDRMKQDEADIISLIRLSNQCLLPDCFNAIDTKIISTYAERFGLRDRINDYFTVLDADNGHML